MTNHLTSTLAAATAAALTLVGVPATAAENLVPNGTFEAAGPDGAPAQWRTVFGDPGAFTVVDDPVHGGAAALRMVDDDTTASVALGSETIQVDAGQSYEVSSWVYRQSGTPAVYAYFYDADGTRVGTDSGTVNTAAESWEQTTISVTAPDDAETMRVLLYSTMSGTATAVWDDVTVQELDPLRLANGGFEEPAADSVPGWQLAYGPGEAFQVVDSPVHSGTQALRMADESTDLSAGLRSSPVTVTGDAAYDVGGWVFIEQGTPSVYVYFYDGSGKEITRSAHSVSAPPNSWSSFSTAVTAPAGAATMRVMVYSTGAGTARAVFDDLTVSESPWVEESMGHPLTSASILSASFGTSSTGEGRAYAVSNGSPAIFQVVDTETGELLHDIPLQGAGGAWSVVTGSDGAVYIGTFPGGTLYRWSEGQDSVTSLGRPTPGARYIWDLEVDDDGMVWGATSHASEVFRYDPTTGEFTDFGRMSATETYARSIAAAEDAVYVGLGSNDPHIAVLDPATGDVSRIDLPERYADATFVYNLEERSGRLLARITGPGISDLVVYDLATGTWSEQVAEIGQVTISPRMPGNLVYYTAAGQLWSYNLTSGETRATGMKAGSARGYTWTTSSEEGYRQGRNLVYIDHSGVIGTYNPTSGEHTTTPADLLETPVALHSIEEGPDGGIYVGGYTYSGLARVDADTGAIEQVTRGGVGQVEGMHAHGGKLYVGSYGHAEIFEYDPASPSGEENPRQIASLLDPYNQDRPFAWTSAGDDVVFGTVPFYGHLGGVLGVYDPATDELAVHEDVVTDQSIVSLTTAGGLVVGGTSIWGGIGVSPTQDSGRIFGWDPATATKVWEITPAPGEHAVTSVTTSPQGTVWAITMDTLMELDPATGEILRSVKLGNYTWGTGSTWVGSHLEFGADGNLYVLSQRSIHQIDPETLARTTLASGVSSFEFTLGGGDVYYFRGDELMRLSASR